MKVQVRVNERGALLNGRFAFTNKFTLVSELLQNGRRAGATSVRVDLDRASRCLVVTDDGCGIEDFQRLLTLNESGWDEATVRNEHPFGVGFSKCLYAAERVSVTSRGMRVSFDCEAAINQAEFEVEAVTDDRQPRLTIVRLDGVDLPELDGLMDRITRGFPIPVVYNGVEQERAHCESAKPFVRTEIGLVYLSGADTGELPTATAIYLQGLLVGTSDRSYYCEHRQVDVIHLDPSRFMARMPDRTELIDAQDQDLLIRAAVCGLWGRLLSERVEQMPADAFAERYYDAARRYEALEVFDALSVLPRQACSIVTGYPNIADGSEAFMESPPRHPSREDIQLGRIRVASCESMDDGDELMTKAYAKAASLTLVHPYLLSGTHGINRGLRNLELEDVAVTPIGATSRSEFRGIYVFVQVVLCEKIEIRHESDVVEISGEALYHEGTILYPSGCSDGEVVKQVAPYSDEDDRFDETAFEADARGLVRLVRALQCPDAASMLKCLLQDIDWQEYPSLAGKTFTVTLKDDADEVAVALAS